MKRTVISPLHSFSKKGNWSGRLRNAMPYDRNLVPEKSLCGEKKTYQ